ncbi:MAG: hypothetical protein JRH12_18125 [Deltaproteobacteria bacterium]|nr:hypothetical protein [Deltaproteobacteria bacterium]MBW2480902.1 hypothetical protein [Deltaproteobacteria bacterium]
MKLNALRAGMVFTSAVFICLLAVGISHGSDAVADTGNCLLCHRYPSIGRYDEEGTKRVFYVNDKKFAASVHGKLACKNCHVGLDKIPHTDVKKVDCATKCHLKEPSTNQEFSHANMVGKFEASVHGKGPAENPKPFAEDLPTCKYCHDNRMYNPFQGMWGSSEALSNETLTRCIGCHTKEDWAKNFYSHFTHRMRQRRTHAEVVKLCTSCHEDSEKMARHGVESIETFKDTFHWNLVRYGVKNAPDCISCHVPLGYSTHDIRPREDPVSPLHIFNRIKTCSNQGGMQVCHPGATAQFAGGRVHAYGTKAQMLVGNRISDYQGVETARLLKRAEADISPEDLFHFTVLKIIKIVYKILIGGTILFMGFHQWLDFLAARRKQKQLKG